MPTCKCGSQVDYVKTAIVKKVMAVEGPPIALVESPLGQSVVVTNGGAIRRGDITKLGAQLEEGQTRATTVGRLVHECWATRLGRSS